MSDNSEVDEVFDTDEVVEPKPVKVKTPKVKTKLSEEKLAKLREQLKKGRETLKAKREAAAKGEKPATTDEPPKKKTAKKVKAVLEEPIKVVVAEPTPVPTPVPTPAPTSVPVQPTPPIKKERKPRQTSNKKNELLDVVNSLREEIKALKQPAAQQVAATPVKQTQPTQPQAPTSPKTEPYVPPAKRFKSPFVPAHW